MAYQGKNPNLGSTVYDNKGVASVANAPSGKVRIINRDGVLLAQDDTGLESQLGAGSGGGTNYMQNGDFETSITDGVSTTGTAPTITAETAAPLKGTQSLNISTGAGTCTVDFAIEDIDNAVVDGQIATLVSGYLKTDANVADGDWTWGVYDTVGAVYVTEQTDLKADTLNVVRAPFVPGFVTAGRYVLRVEFTDTTASRELIVDKLITSPDSNSGLIDPSPEFYIKLQGGHGNTHGTTYTNIRRFNSIDSGYNNPGSAMTVDFDNAPNGSSITINEDGIYNISYTDGRTGSQCVFGVSLNITVGEATTVIQGITDSKRLTLSRGGDDTGGVGNCSVTRFLSAGDVLRAHTDGTPDRTSNTDVFFTVTQVQRFTEKVNLLTQDVIKANARAKYNLSDGSVLTSGSYYTFDTEVYNQGGFTVAGTDIIIPADGTYRIYTQIRYASANMGSGGRLILHVDAGSAAFGRTSTGGVDGGTMNMYWEGQLTKGQTVEIQQNGVTSPTQDTGPDDSFLTISRIAEYGAFEPTGFGLATDTVAGLLPATTLMGDGLATALGYKAYSHGTNYNGGNAPTITLAGGGGSLSAVTICKLFPYQDQDGDWFLNFTILVTLSSASRTEADIAIAGTSFEVEQAISASPDVSSVAIHGNCRTSGSGQLRSRHATATTSIYSYTGAAIALTAKPDWAY